ncbi:uncharacterized protein EV422DRAFT_545965 [Fimicolochytrium jonesii]|uniref:uncharacterized protein n=1 Tax=Fimicolochytrium jonesii TaxID=1396493 RepID=UPI0022FEA324|nr:uncharacterized protein EV422DRAFT_545965 [Fimicolochytrium jonesii]KAI8816426.1 hypothetical protein EV422DRAFT_545965 [Fimicolochytrium jonesii]
MAESKRVTVTYSHGADADETTAAIAFVDELQSKLPLRNVGWQNPLGRGATRPPRVIDALEIDVKRYHADMFPRVMPGTLYHSPYFLHLYLVATDETEAYKANIRKSIQEWLNVVANKKNQEWLIVYLNNPDAKGKSARFLGVGATTVYDKIKSDFNFKKERCIRMKLYNDPQRDTEAWAEMQNHLKEGILSSLNQQIVQYDEDTRRIDQQRLIPGWNYCNYFVMKEGLAYTFEFMNLLDEALVQYDELEASFFQTLSEQGAPWFANIGGTEAGDDSGDILNLQRKPYRDRIMQNTVSIFDFRIYLFARQCQLLFRLRNANAVGERAKAFIVQMAKSLRENEVSLYPYFRKVWVYFACISVVRHCDEVMAMLSQTADAMAAYDGVKADLLEIARTQLQALGAACGVYEEMFVPTEDAAAAPVGDTTALVSALSNAELQNALSSTVAFDELYLKMIARIISSCENRGRYRINRMLKAELAHIHYSRGRIPEAASLWESLTGRPTDENWPLIDDLFTSKMATCWQKLQNHEKYLQSCIYLLSNSRTMSAERKQHYSTELLVTVKALTQAFIVRNCTILGVKVMIIVNSVADDEGATAEISLQNGLEQEFALDDVTMRLTSTEGKDYIFTNRGVAIGPDSAVIALAGEKISMSGTYSATRLALRLGKLDLVYDNLGAFNISGSPLPLRVTAGLADQASIGDSRSNLQVKVFTSSHSIQQGTLSISSPTLLTFPAVKTVSFRITSDTDGQSHNKECSIDALDNKIVLPATGAHEVITFLIPYNDQLSGQSLDHAIKFVIDYTSQDGKHYLASLLETPKLKLPLSISHEVSHNPVSALLQYTLTGRNNSPIRLLDVGLSSSSLMRAESCFSKDERLVFEQQEVPLVYKLQTGVVPEGRQGSFNEAVDKKAQLTISYCYLSEEMEAYLLSRMDEMLTTAGMNRYSGCLNYYVRETVLPKLDFIHYAVHDTVAIPALDAEALQTLLPCERPEIAKQLVSFMKGYHEALQAISGQDVRERASGSVRKLLHNAEINLCKILVGAKVVPAIAGNGNKSLTVGEAMQCQLIIETSKWDSSLSTITGHYEVSADYESWMFAGKKKESLSLDAKTSSIFEFTVVPTRTGYLPLPAVSIQTSESGVALFYPNRSRGIIVKPPTSVSHEVFFET